MTPANIVSAIPAAGQGPAVQAVSALLPMEGQAAQPFGSLMEEVQAGGQDAGGKVAVTNGGQATGRAAGFVPAQLAGTLLSARGPERIVLAAVLPKGMTGDVEMKGEPAPDATDTEGHDVPKTPRRADAAATAPASKKDAVPPVEACAADTPLPDMTTVQLRSRGAFVAADAEQEQAETTQAETTQAGTVPDKPVQQVATEPAPPIVPAAVSHHVLAAHLSVQAPLAPRFDGGREADAMDEGQSRINMASSTAPAPRMTVDPPVSAAGEAGQANLPGHGASMPDVDQGAGSSITFVQSLPAIPARVAAGQPYGVAADEPPAVSAQTGRIGHEMGVSIARGIDAGREVMIVRLDPAEMGRIHVRLSFDHDGAVRVAMSAESSNALDMLRREAGDLVRALSDAGVRSDSQSFRFDGGGNAQGFGQQRGGDDGQSQRRSPSGAFSSSAGAFSSSESETGSEQTGARQAMRSSGGLNLII